MISLLFCRSHSWRFQRSLYRKNNQELHLITYHLRNVKRRFVAWVIIGSFAGRNTATRQYNDSKYQTYLPSLFVAVCLLFVVVAVFLLTYCFIHSSAQASLDSTIDASHGLSSFDLCYHYLLASLGVIVNMKTSKNNQQIRSENHRPNIKEQVLYLFLLSIGKHNLLWLQEFNSHLFWPHVE